MLPIFFIVGLINIFSQHRNYGIKIEDPNFDIRVRRSIEDALKPRDFGINNKVENYFKTDVLKRGKRYAYYKKTTITNNDLHRFNNTQENNNTNGSQSRKVNRYDIFNPHWNFLFNTTRNNSNNSGVKNGFINNNKRPVRSYPYGYPPGYAPKTTGSHATPTTPVFRNQNNNITPYYYNYQNPEGQNFAGYVGYTANTPGYNQVTPRYNNIPVPYAPAYTPRPNNNYAPWNNPLASYPPNYTQNLGPATTNNINNKGIHNLPYAPANGEYKNNFNSIPTPFKKDNLSSYAPNFNNGSAMPNNTFAPYTPVNNTLVPYSPVNNTDVTPSNINSTVTTTEKMIIMTGCVICNIPCPQFMRRFGSLCVNADADDDY